MVELSRRAARTALPSDPRTALAAQIISGTACEALARRVAPGARLRARRHGRHLAGRHVPKRAPRAAHANNPRAPRAPLTPQNAILHPATPHLAPTRRALGQRRARRRPLSLQLERTQRFSSRFLNCAAPAPRARACCTHLIARGDTRGQLGVACSLGPRPAACAAAAGGRASAARCLFACGCAACLAFCQQLGARLAHPACWCRPTCALGSEDAGKRVAGCKAVAARVRAGRARMRVREHYCKIRVRSKTYRRITTAFREAPPCYTKPRTYFEVVALIVNIRP